MTKKKKLSNPIMSPEWIKSLLDVCVVPTVALDEFGTMSDEQAEAIGALLEGASGEQSTAAPLRGDGGMSIDAIKLDDAYYTIKRLLDDNLVTSREVCEFVDAVERLIER